MLEKTAYGHAFKKGRREHGKCFTLIVCRNGLDKARLGLAVSRKVSPRAVVRNRIKRQIRETFRLKQSRLKGYDCVVVAKKAAAASDRTTLRTSLDSHWRKISENA